MTKENRFTHAIEENKGIIYKAASLFASNLQDREDLIQEITIQLWRSFDSFKSMSTLSTWMYRVSMNVAIYHRKKSRRAIVTVELETDLAENIGNTDSIDDENWTILNASIANLNLLERGILLLYLEAKSHQEIADLLGMSKTNIGTKLGRIKQKLKRNENNNKK